MSEVGNQLRDPVGPHGDFRVHSQPIGPERTYRVQADLKGREPKNRENLPKYRSLLDFNRVRKSYNLFKYYESEK